jgi:hypothetical protein
MNGKTLLALAAGILVGGAALAQNADPNASPQDQLKARRAAAEAASQTPPGEMQTLKGTVKSYKAGKKIVVTDAEGKNHSLKLDESARVESAPNPGDAVTVMWITDTAGKQRVTSVATGTTAGTGATSANPGTSGASSGSGTSTSSSSTSGEDRAKPPAPAPAPVQPTPIPK